LQTRPRPIDSYLKGATDGGAQLIGGDAAQIMILFSPGDLLEGTNAAIFGTEIGNPIIANLDISGLVYVGATLALTAIAVALTVRRYLRIAA